MKHAKHTLTPIVLAIVIGITAFSQAAQAQLVCGERPKMVANLKSFFQEEPKSMGLQADGSVVEVFVSPDGSFTMLVTIPNGTSCVVMAGQDWENLSSRKAGLGI